MPHHRKLIKGQTHIVKPVNADCTQVMEERRRYYNHALWHFGYEGKSECSTILMPDNRNVIKERVSVAQSLCLITETLLRKE